MDSRNSLQQELERMSSPRLAELLDQETRKDPPDDEMVLLLLHILERREAGNSPALGEREAAAWRSYRAKRSGGKRWLDRGIRAASLAALVCLLFALLPRQASAGSAWKILARWTDRFFEYGNIGDPPTEPEPYTFRSENPGLVELYDAVTEDLDVTEPVVPQWLPDGYELAKLESIDTHSEKGVIACFTMGENEAVLSYREMTVDLSPKYEKTEEEPKKMEADGITHSYMWNKNSWTVCWTRQTLKCVIGINCPEEELQTIVRSIYE